MPTGSFVQQGDRIGAIVPEGKVRIVAYFHPGEALGRVRAGQPAKMRLQGFPWSQFGSIAARVKRVAGEVREGLVFVELAPDHSAATTIPVQHGLPGAVEVEVERVSPVSLVLRIAGKRFGWSGARSEQRLPELTDD